MAFLRLISQRRSCAWGTVPVAYHCTVHIQGRGWLPKVPVGWPAHGVDGVLLLAPLIRE